MKKITKNMILGEVARKYPETINVFLNHGLPCAMCHIAFHETIEQGAKSHGINVKKLVEELNKAIKKK
jgi:hybrid cluster-associated redox disulfide protein